MHKAQAGKSTGLILSVLFLSLAPSWQVLDAQCSGIRLRLGHLQASFCQCCFFSGAILASAGCSVLRHKAQAGKSTGLILSVLWRPKNKFGLAKLFGTPRRQTQWKVTRPTGHFPGSLSGSLSYLWGVLGGMSGGMLFSLFSLLSLLSPLSLSPLALLSYSLSLSSLSPL